MRNLLSSVCKKNFCANKILREINFDEFTDFRSSKIAISTILIFKWVQNEKEKISLSSLQINKYFHVENNIFALFSCVIHAVSVHF